MSEDKSDINLGASKGVDESAGDCPDIWIDPEVDKRIREYVGTDTGKELAGVLLGEVVTDPDGSLVRVLAEIEAKHTEAVHTSVTFTHATWEDIYKVKEESYPDLRIVGWFHSHPGFGIFLSRWDMFIQQNFFNLPWQIAYVVDPVNNTRGFFRWEDSKVAEVGKPRRDVMPPAEIDVLDYTLKPRRSRLFTGLNVAAILGLSAAVVYLGFFKPPKEKIVERKVVIHEKAPVQVAAKPAPTLEADAREYTIRKGDCFWTIARYEYGDATYARAIAWFNNVDGKNMLTVGSHIRLPNRKLAAQMLGRKP